MKKIYLDAPTLGQLEKEYLAKAIDSGYISTAGPFVPEFENRFARYLKVKNAVATQSGTAALHMALYELGIGPGDEVIVPNLTFIATANPVIYVGATPVFADVDPKTWTLDPNELQKKITAKTRAIIPVHLFGNPCQMTEIAKTAHKRNIAIIEDATESLGATYHGQLTGKIGTFGCFSFNGNKIITTGGGGMIICASLKRLAHIKLLINQAKKERTDFYHPEVGFNYRLTNIEAALGMAQLLRLKEFLKQKKEFNRIYRDQLRGIDAIRFQESYPQAESNYWLTCLIFRNDINIKKIQQKLLTHAITTRRIFPPITSLPPYKKYSRGEEYTHSEHIFKQGLCFPSSTLNPIKSVYWICDILKQILRSIKN